VALPQPIPRAMQPSGNDEERIDLQLLGLSHDSLPPAEALQTQTWSANPIHHDVESSSGPATALAASEPSESVDIPEVENGRGTRSSKAQPNFMDLRQDPDVSIVSALRIVTVRLARKHIVFILMMVVLAIALALLGALVFDPLRWQAWASFVIASICLGLLVDSSLTIEVVMLVGTAVMLILKIVTPSEAINGFANTGVATVAVLFIVAEGLQRTSLLIPVFRAMLGNPTKLWIAQIRLMVPVALISTFIYNTACTALLVPITQSWCRRSKFPLSKLLLPLHHAITLGGNITLLGTATHFVVSGLVTDSTLVDENGSKVELPIFGIALPGLIILPIGLVYLLIAAQFLLTDTGAGSICDMVKNPREYTVPLLVTEKSPIVGKTVSTAGLRELKGLYLVEITREDGSVLPAVSPDAKIEANDVLLFAGVVETVTELYHIAGVVPATEQSAKMTHVRHHRRLVELVISPRSFLAGKTARETKFRSRFDSAIIAVHRRGEHIKGKIGEILLQGGDTLLVETGPFFISLYGKDSNFALVSEVSGSQPPRTDALHRVIAAVTVAVMVAVVIADKLTLFESASAACLVLIVTGCLSLRQAAHSVNMPVMLAMAASFGISKGVEVSGAAEALANAIIDAFKGLGIIGLLFGIYIATSATSSFVNKNAAAGTFPDWQLAASRFPLRSTRGQLFRSSDLLYIANINLASSLSLFTFDCLWGRKP
jgi:di/tricarboxylate transporter